MSLHTQVILLCAASNRLLMDIPLDKLEDFKQDVVSYIEKAHPVIVSEIENSKKLTEELKYSILKAVAEFKSR
jgi:F-type H+-transporting ATPase subunit alpha